MTRLLLVRHGETAWNNDARYQGHVDVALNEKGILQAQRLRNHLLAEPIVAVYTSDLRRASQTAEIVAAARGLSILPCFELRELSFGRFEGLTHAEVERRFPTERRYWLEDTIHRQPPGGESLTQLQQRVVGFARAVIGRHPGETVLLVGHNGSLKTLLWGLLDIGLETYWRVRLGNTSLSIAEVDERRTTLLLLNDTCHLDGNLFE